MDTERERERERWTRLWQGVSIERRLPHNRSRIKSKFNIIYSITRYYNNIIYNIEFACVCLRIVAPFLRFHAEIDARPAAFMLQPKLVIPWIPCLWTLGASYISCKKSYHSKATKGQHLIVSFLPPINQYNIGNFMHQQQKSII